MNIFKKWIYKYIKPFFFSKSDKGARIKPPYLWATIFLFITLIMLCIQIGMICDLFDMIKNNEMTVENAANVPTLSTVIAAMVVLVIGLIHVYNKGRKNGKEKVNGEEENIN